MKRQAGRPRQENGAPVGHHSKSRDILAEESGESREQIRRYIRLTNLVPELLELVDEGRIKMRPAVELSYLDEDSQRDVVEQIDINDCTPSHDQTIRMRKMFESGKLTAEAVEAIMSEEKPNQRERIVLRGDRVRSLIPKNAKLHDISYEKLLNDIKSGIYTTTVQDGSMYLIDKNEPCKTTRIDERNTPPKDGYLSVSEYVAKHNVTRNEILYDVKAGIYETAKLINGRWYIKEDEPCKTYGDNYISLAAYAKLHNVSRSKLLEDVESGVYSTPVTKHNRWLIDKNEPFKSVDKRKKENKEQIIISARQYSINHKLPYIKVLADMKAGNYATAFQNGNRWFIDSKESPKTKVRPYKRKKLTE